MSRKIENLKQLFCVGKKVTLSNGVFNGYEGNIVTSDFNRQKLTVNLTVSGMNVEVGMEDVEL